MAANDGERELRVKVRLRESEAAFAEGITLPGVAMVVSVVAIATSVADKGMQLIALIGALGLSLYLGVVALAAPRRARRAVDAQMRLEHHLDANRPQPPEEPTNWWPAIGVISAVLAVFAVGFWAGRTFQ